MNKAKLTGATKLKRPNDRMRRQRIIEFVHQVNHEQGQGGIAAASRRFGISPGSLRKWMSEAEGAQPRRGEDAARRSEGMPGIEVRPKSERNRITKTLARMIKVDQRIATLRQKLDTEQAHLDTLKQQI